MRIFIPIDGSERSLNAVRYVANKPAFSRLCQPKNGNGLRHRVAGHFKFHFT